MIEPIVWIGFIVMVFFLMAIDLGLLNKKAHTPSSKEALFSTLGWVLLALVFNVWIYFAYENHWLNLGTYIHEPMDGKDAALKFLTGYLLEESLSIDNLFVMALVFARFQVPKQYQHRILFWGILGVLVFRPAQNLSRSASLCDVLILIAPLCCMMALILWISSATSSALPSDSHSRIASAFRS